MAAATNSSGERLISAIELAPSSVKPSSPSTRRCTFACFTSRIENVASKSRMNGPTAADALLSFALPSRSADRPSTSRRLTSLPSAAPTILPLLDEMMTCVAVWDAHHKDYRTDLLDDDIEEIATRFLLRAEVVELHTGFPVTAALSTLGAAVPLREAWKAS